MTQPAVTVVIATYNRPQRLMRLLRCVRDQDIDNFECLVIDDGSPDAVIAEYHRLWPELDSRFRLVCRSQADGAPRGPGATRNCGVRLAQGKYVAFCDDDDRWLRRDHLRTACGVLDRQSADFYFANMQTSVAEAVRNPDWYGVAAPYICNAPVDGYEDIYDVSVDGLCGLLKHRGLHADTLVIRRQFLLDIGLYWDKIGFAEDHDFSFRLADRAGRVLYRSTVVGDLDVSPHASIARTYDGDERSLFGILASLHAECAMRHAQLRRVARSNRSWRMLEMAETRSAAGDRRAALEFILQSLLIHPSWRAIRMAGKTLWRGPSKDGRSSGDAAAPVE